MKLVKVYHPDGSYSVLFEDEQGAISYNSDGTYAFSRSTLHKTEPLEQGDTLQEVIEWCKENEQRFMVDGNDTVEAIQDEIRKPKLKEITLEEANEILKEQGKIIEL